MRSGRVTIRAVAREAGVSVSTVSNVASGRYHQMSEATRDRVLAAMKRLEYRPNHVARSLVTNRTSTIGLIIGDVANTLYPMVTIGAEAACREAGFSLLLASAEDETAERRSVELMRAMQVDAIILFSISMIDSGSDFLKEAHLAGTPIVTLNRTVTPDAPMSSVWFDHRGGARQATQHLIELGHRQIAYIGGPVKRQTGIERRAGFLDAHDDAGIAPENPLMRNGDYTFESGYRHMYDLISSGPTAAFVAGDVMALGALRALWERGLSVPGDCSLVAFGDPDCVRFSTPALTTIDLPVADAGREVVELAVSRIEHPTGKEVRRLKTTLLVRETTAPPSSLRESVTLDHVDGHARLALSKGDVNS